MSLPYRLTQIPFTFNDVADKLKRDSITDVVIFQETASGFRPFVYFGESALTGRRFYFTQDYETLSEMFSDRGIKTTNTVVIGRI